MPRGTVLVDETYINDTDLSKGYGQARKRGMSRQKPCICVAIDVHKNPVTVVCGQGKPSSARVWNAMGGRIAPGSLLIHGLERGPRRAGQGRRARERGAQGRCERPGLSGADGDGERPVLQAEALPVALHGEVTQEPAGLPCLVRLPLQGQPDARQAGSDCTGGAAYPDGRRDLPQLGIGVAPPVI